MWARSDRFSFWASGWKLGFWRPKDYSGLTGDHLWGAWQDRNTVGGHFVRIVCGDSGAKCVHFCAKRPDVPEAGDALLCSQ